MKLVCQRCGHGGSADLSFVWHSEDIKRKDGSEVTAWLCPECKQEFRSEAARTAFLREQVQARTRR